jgi:hypothetical protein
VSCDDAKRLVFGTLDNEPVTDATGKLKLGTELAISFDQIKKDQTIGVSASCPIP